MVVFHPRGTQAGLTHKPQGYTGAEGGFALTTNQPGDGAPAGDYDVTVELRDKRRVGEEIVRDGRNLLPARYSKPGSSGLHCQIQEGRNELPPFKLTK